MTHVLILRRTNPTVQPETGEATVAKDGAGFGGNHMVNTWPRGLGHRSLGAVLHE